MVITGVQHKRWRLAGEKGKVRCQAIDVGLGHKKAFGTRGMRRLKKKTSKRAMGESLVRFWCALRF